MLPARCRRPIAMSGASLHGGAGCQRHWESPAAPATDPCPAMRKLTLQSEWRVQEDRWLWHIKKEGDGECLLEISHAGQLSDSPARGGWVERAAAQACCVLLSPCRNSAHFESSKSNGFSSCIAILSESTIACRSMNGKGRAGERALPAQRS